MFDILETELSELFLFFILSFYYYSNYFYSISSNEFSLSHIVQGIVNVNLEPF